MTDGKDSEKEEISPQLAALFQEYASALAEDNAAGVEVATRAVMDEVGRFAQEAVENNTSFGKDLCLTLAAEEAEADKQWTIARGIYQEQLHRAIEEDHVPQQVRFHLRLSGLSIREGHYQSAFESAKTAAEKARTFGVPSLLDMALGQLSSAARRLGRIEDAIAAATEGLSLVQETQLNDITRACLLVQRAHALLIANEMDKAREDLNNAWQLFPPEKMQKSLPGVRWRLASWWRVEAKLRARCSDWEHARQAWESALECMQNAVSVWQVEGWESEAAVKLCQGEIDEVRGEFADAAVHVGDQQLAALLRARRS